MSDTEDANSFLVIGGLDTGTKRNKVLSELVKYRNRNNKTSYFFNPNQSENMSGTLPLFTRRMASKSDGVYPEFRPSDGKICWFGLDESGQACKNENALCPKNKSLVRNCTYSCMDTDKKHNERTLLERLLLSNVANMNVVKTHKLEDVIQKYIKKLVGEYVNENLFDYNKVFEHKVNIYVRKLARGYVQENDDDIVDLSAKIDEYNATKGGKRARTELTPHTSVHQSKRTKFENTDSTTLKSNKRSREVNTKTLIVGNTQEQSKQKVRRGKTVAEMNLLKKPETDSEKQARFNNELNSLLQSRGLTDAPNPGFKIGKGYQTAIDHMISDKTPKLSYMKSYIEHVSKYKDREIMDQISELVGRMDVSNKSQKSALHHLLQIHANGGEITSNDMAPLSLLINGAQTEHTVKVSHGVNKQTPLEHPSEQNDDLFASDSESESTTPIVQEPPHTLRVNVATKKYTYGLHTDDILTMIDLLMRYKDDLVLGGQKEKKELIMEYEKMNDALKNKSDNGTNHRYQQLYESLPIYLASSILEKHEDMDHNDAINFNNQLTLYKKHRQYLKLTDDLLNYDKRARGAKYALDHKMKHVFDKEMHEMDAYYAHASQYAPHTTPTLPTQPIMPRPHGKQSNVKTVPTSITKLPQPIQTTQKQQVVHASVDKQKMTSDARPLAAVDNNEYMNDVQIEEYAQKIMKFSNNRAFIDTRFIERTDVNPDMAAYRDSLRTDLDRKLFDTRNDHILICGLKYNSPVIKSSDVNHWMVVHVTKEPHTVTLYPFIKDEETMKQKELKGVTYGPALRERIDKIYGVPEKGKHVYGTKNDVKQTLSYTCGAFALSVTLMLAMGEPVPVSTQGMGDYGLAARTIILTKPAVKDLYEFLRTKIDDTYNKIYDKGEDRWINTNDLLTYFDQLSKSGSTLFADRKNSTKFLTATNPTLKTYDKLYYIFVLGVTPSGLIANKDLKKLRNENAKVNHWVTMLVDVSTDDATISIHDPMPARETSTQYINSVYEYGQQFVEKVRAKRPNIKQPTENQVYNYNQNDEYNCGVWAAAIATSIYMGFDVPTLNLTVSEFRKFMLSGAPDFGTIQSILKVAQV